MLNILQSKIPYNFKNKGLLEMALTHTSAANELGETTEHNERLEFLGDAVLELCISQELYRRFPDAREGGLTSMRSQLVNQPTLANIARNLSLDKCLRLGKGEESQGGRNKDSLLSDTFEALLGAIYIDSDLDAALKVVQNSFSQKWGDLDSGQKTKDYKSQLQEFTQLEYKERPIYSLLDSSGPEHAKIFRVSLLLPSGRSFEASGSSVKKAEQKAASLALSVLGVATKE